MEKGKKVWKGWELEGGEGREVRERKGRERKGERRKGNRVPLVLFLEINHCL